MCPLPQDKSKEPIDGVQNHHFIRNEYWNEEEERWLQMAGTRLPDNRANRMKLKRDVDAMTKKGMKSRSVKYQVIEDVIGVFYGDGAVVGLK